MLGTALDGCDVGTLTNKLGGQVRADCSIWNLTTVAGKNGMPPNDFPRRSVLLAYCCGVVMQATVRLVNLEVRSDGKVYDQGS
jgi:hypothetical protein